MYTVWVRSCSIRFIETSSQVQNLSDNAGELCWLRCMSRKCGFVDWITITLTGLSMESAVQFVIFAILSHTEIYCSVAKWREGVGGGRGVTWLEQPCTQSICAAKQTIDVTKGLHNWDRVETIYIWMHQFQLVQLNAWFACVWAANRFTSLKHAYVYISRWAVPGCHHQAHIRTHSVIIIIN